MSSSKRPVHPTRQQLDELEALLQRMLALPVNQLEGESSSLSLPALTPIDMPPDWESGDAAVLSTESPRPPREHGPTDKSERATDETRAAGSGQFSKSLAVTGDADEPERSADSPRWTEPE